MSQPSTLHSNILPDQPQLTCTDDLTHGALACHTVIIPRSHLMELYDGARLLRLVSLNDRDRRRGAVWEWQRPAGYEGPDEWHVHPGMLGEAPPASEAVWAPRKREKIRGFSRQSRMRLLRKMNMIASAELGYAPKFVTLTYPRELLPSWEWAKNQLDNWIKAFERQYGNHAMLWRMEFQEDGSIHFHIMLFIKRFVPWWWVARTWDRLIGNQVAPIDSASTQIRAMQNWRQTHYYLSKYIAKDDESAYWDQEHGRHWGSRRWDLLPIHRALIALSDREHYQMRRWTHRWLHARGVRVFPLGKAGAFTSARDTGITAFMPAKLAWRMFREVRGYGREAFRLHQGRTMPNGQ